MAQSTDGRRQLVNFILSKLEPAWRMLPDEQKQHDREQLCHLITSWIQPGRMLILPYSTVGIRADADIMMWRICYQLEDLQQMSTELSQTGLGRYLFVYPFEKKREWYRLEPSERQRIMDDHIAIGRRYPQIAINTAYSFGLDDQEFVVSFEADDPGQFLDLVQELRGSESSSYTLRDTPIFTCVAMSVAKALDALDGAATSRGAAALA